MTWAEAQERSEAKCRALEAQVPRQGKGREGGHARVLGSGWNQGESRGGGKEGRGCGEVALLVLVPSSRCLTLNLSRSFLVSRLKLTSRATLTPSRLSHVSFKTRTSNSPSW